MSPEKEREIIEKMKKQMRQFEAKLIAIHHRQDVTEEFVQKVNGRADILLERINHITQIIMKYEDEQQQKNNKGEMKPWDS